MSIASLQKAVPPPDAPLGVAKRRWASAERHLGTKLPADYRAYAAAYGSGRFMVGAGQLDVYNPMDERYPEFIDEHLAFVRDARKASGDYFNLEVHPAQPGLLPVAFHPDGHFVFYLTEGDPDRWPVVTLGHDADSFEYHRPSLTGLLAAAFGGRADGGTKPPSWARRWAKAGARFEPGLAVPPSVGAAAERTLFDLYAANGNRARFWAENAVYAPSVTYYVKSVGGHSSGPLAGEPPEYDGVAVIGDVWEDGERTGIDIELDVASFPGFVVADPPAGAAR